MDKVYDVLTNINDIIIIIFSVAFLFQIIYILLFFVPTKKYAPAKVEHFVAVIIPAHNESKVIFATVKNILMQNYSADKFKIFVVADNCTDDTAALAAKAGAEVIIHNSVKGEKKNAGTAVDFGIKYIIENYPQVEFFVRFDADNIPHPDYLKKMNDAFDSGVKAAKGYNHSFNFTQNTVSGISSLWYIRDNAFTCRARSFLHLSQVLVGGGMMFSKEVVKDGFGCFSNSEDMQFTLKLARKRINAKYVADAVVYEDNPGSLGDLFKRNMRMGGGLFKLFFTDGIKSFFYFFATFNISILDLLLTLIFVPIALVGVAWFPFYYVYSVAYLGAIGDIAAMLEVLKMIGIILGVAFIVPFILQALLAYLVERKKMGVPFKKLIGAILLFPMYMIIYAIGIVLGILGFSGWKVTNRNAYYDESFIIAYEKASGRKPYLAGVDYSDEDGEDNVESAEAAVENGGGGSNTELVGESGADTNAESAETKGETKEEQT